MKVFLSDEIIFDNLTQAAEFIAKLPSFSLTQLNVICVDDECKLYHVIVYCFDDDIDCTDYL